MLDDFRQQAGDSLLDEPQDIDTGFQKPVKERRILGMTPFQTFFISFLLFLLTCILSSSCLLVTGRVAVPFL